LKLTPKGRRHGIEVPWPALLAITGREQTRLAAVAPPACADTRRRRQLRKISGLTARGR